MQRLLTITVFQGKKDTYYNYPLHINEKIKKTKVFKKSIRIFHINFHFGTSFNLINEPSGIYSIFDNISMKIN